MKRYLKGKSGDMKSADIWSAPGGGVTQEEWDERVGKHEAWYDKRDRENAEKENNHEV